MTIIYDEFRDLIFTKSDQNFLGFVRIREYSNWYALSLTSNFVTVWYGMGI